MNLLEVTDEPEFDRDRLMKTACLIYLLAATDAHAKNFSLLYSRGADRPSIRLAPLYDVASAWPYPRQIPPQKMKLAMRIGKRYKLREIQTRHFEELAKTCRYPAEKLIVTLRELSERLPDEALAVKDEFEKATAAPEVVTRLVDGLALQCKAVRRSMSATTNSR
jgi:serine/threonine-protein kinase HipA